MPTPIIEQIAVKIKARLTAISTGNGYETTASGGVIRPTLIDETQPKDYQIYLTQETPTKNDAFSCPGNPAKRAWDQPFRIALGLRPSEKDTTPIDTLRNTFFGDVQKALAQPTSGDWSQWDGLAIQSSLGSADWYLDDEGSAGGVQAILTVTYRTPENDPYTMAG